MAVAGEAPQRPQVGVLDEILVGVAAAELPAVSGHVEQGELYETLESRRVAILGGQQRTGGGVCHYTDLGLLGRVGQNAKSEIGWN